MQGLSLDKKETRNHEIINHFMILLFQVRILANKQKSYQKQDTKIRTHEKSIFILQRGQF